MKGVTDDPRYLRGFTVQLDWRRKRLAQGEKGIGWKVGFGSAAAMKVATTNAPMVGFLTDKGRLSSGASVSLTGWVKPAAEEEIAIYIGRDVPAGASREVAKAAVAAIGPALELADLAYPPQDVERVMSENIFHRYVVLGPKDTSRAGLELGGLAARISKNGTVVGTPADLEANTGDLVGHVQHVAGTLAALGEALRAGDVIIPGAVIPPVMVAPGDEVIFELGTAGTVSATFTG